MNPPVFLGLGANLGDRAAAIESGLLELAARGFETLVRSSLWQTEPIGGPPQGWFLNAAVGGRTTLSPEALLEACLAAEQALGRVRTVRNGPRTLDVDLLLYGDVRLETPGLTVPHPRMHERRFVLEPLCEIAPELRHPVLGATIRELRERCPDHSRVERYRPSTAEGR